MNILFIGKFYPKELRKTVKEDSKGRVGFSNHNFEESIISGLKKQKDINLKIISVPCVYSYPHNNKKLFTKSEKYDSDGVPVKSIGFCNLVCINKILIVLKLIYNLVSTFAKFNEKQINVILSTPNFYQMIALFVVKRMSKKDIHTTLIIPDIPSFISQMDKANRIKSFFISKKDTLSMKLANQFDNHVLLTEQMVELFPRKLKYIVMEGIVDIDRMDLSVKETENKPKNIILYTGTLRKIFGVMNLVEAFNCNMFADAELWICGSGEAKDDIERLVQSNPRMKFFGLVDSEKALELQRMATVLVNPRTAEGEFTKYSFPSKTMEYMLAERAVVINRLPGIPSEYYKYVYTPSNSSIESLRLTLREVLDLDSDYRNSIAKLGKEFIINNKNSQVQVARIIAMINSK